MALLNILQIAESAPDSLSRRSVLEIISSVSESGGYDLQAIFNTICSEAIHFFANIVVALAIYIIGKWLLKRLLSFMDKTFEARQIEVSVRSFLRSMISIVFYILLILTVIQILGINTTSLVAMLASAGLAVGMALSGTLQNFAGGIMILFLKPYRIGDYITSQGESGIVKDIKLFTTVLETYDRHTIFVPNSAISSSIIDNATYSDLRRLDWSVGISYGDSVDDARAAILAIFAEDARIMNNPANAGQMPVVNVVGLGNSSVDLMARAWVKTEDYWGVYFDIYEQIYKRLPESGVRFPFPQMDVHLKSNN